MTGNTQQPNKVTIIHIFTNIVPGQNLDPMINRFQGGEIAIEIVENNANFLYTHNVEYIILDNLTNLEENTILGKIAQTKSFQEKKFEYVKMKKSQGETLREIFLTGSKLASHQNIFFIFNTIKLDMNNIFEVETTCPLLRKSDLAFFEKNVPENFNPKNYKLYMKKNKNILDKIKLYLKLF